MVERQSNPGNSPLFEYLHNAPHDDAVRRRGIYRTIGVEPIINCRGTFTIIGGSVQRPEALLASEAAAHQFVQYDELAEGVGRRLAEVTGAEWGMVSAGCAAGLKHVAAACVTGGNPERLIRIPDLTGLPKTQVVAPWWARNAYDHAIRNIGIEFIEVDTPEALAAAIGPKTAMVYTVASGRSATGQPLSLETLAEIAHPAGVPVLIDAAAEDLTVPNIHLARGADVVAYSGGKAICGPQSAGLLLGRKDILQAAWQASAPHHGPGRDDKVGREDAMGMLAAVEAWVRRDHAAEWEAWLERLDHIAQQARRVPGVETTIEEPRGLSNHSPTLVIAWDPAALRITGEEVAEDFARKAPRIALGSGDEEGMASIRVTPSQMQPGEEQVVGTRVYDILAQERPSLVAGLAPATIDLSGHWAMTVEYVSSTSSHRLYLLQEGNWVTGMHRGEFSEQEIVGSVEGDAFKLRSLFRRPGDHIPFLFAGWLVDDTLSGSIHLGEYGTARFTAVRATCEKLDKPFAIPSGPPLAT